MVVLWIAVVGWTLGISVWLFLDARNHDRPALWWAVASVMLPGVAAAVYVGTRHLAGPESDELSTTGHQLLREMTEEIKRLRAELAAAQAELAERHA